jgi:hypothetical protein
MNRGSARWPVLRGNKLAHARMIPVIRVRGLGE